MYADRVNVRNSPSLDGQVLFTLAEGTPLEMIYGMSETTLNDESGSWKIVRYQGKTGYIWGPLLAFQAVRSMTDPEVLFVLGPNKNQEEVGVKVFRNGKRIQEFTFKGLKSLHQMSRFESKGNKGVKGIEDLLYITYYAEACGEIGGDVMLAWDGKLLRHFFTSTSMGDGGLFEIEEIVLPADLHGEKGSIVVYKESGEYHYDNEQIENQTVEYFQKEIHRYRWNGERLIKE